ncbi:hypothetical protein MRB53_040222 [Persea americana]|nr:hypothetical protein MRB53_040222 [Persea americana]
MLQSIPIRRNKRRADATFDDDDDSAPFTKPFMIAIRTGPTTRAQARRDEEARAASELLPSRKRNADDAELEDRCGKRHCDDGGRPAPVDEEPDYITMHELAIMAEDCEVIELNPKVLVKRWILPVPDHKAFVRSQKQRCEAATELSTDPQDRVIVLCQGYGFATSGRAVCSSISQSSLKSRGLTVRPFSSRTCQRSCLDSTMRRAASRWTTMMIRRRSPTCSNSYTWKPRSTLRTRIQPSSPTSWEHSGIANRRTVTASLDQRTISPALICSLSRKPQYCLPYSVSSWRYTRSGKSMASPSLSSMCVLSSKLTSRHMPDMRASTMSARYSPRSISRIRRNTPNTEVKPETYPVRLHGDTEAPGIEAFDRQPAIPGVIGKYAWSQVLRRPLECALERRGQTSFFHVMQESDDLKHEDMVSSLANLTADLEDMVIDDLYETELEILDRQRAIRRQHDEQKQFLGSGGADKLDCIGAKPASQFHQRENDVGGQEERDEVL